MTPGEVIKRRSRWIGRYWDGNVGNRVDRGWVDHGNGTFSYRVLVPELVAVPGFGKSSLWCRGWVTVSSLPVVSVEMADSVDNVDKGVTTSERPWLGRACPSAGPCE